MKLAKYAFDQTLVEYLGLVITNGEVYSDKRNCYNVWYFCSVHNVVCACVGISLSIGETV